MICVSLAEEVVGMTIADLSRRCALSKNIPRNGPLKPQISTTLLRAPVEMTKGRAALPGSVVAEQKPFSSPWVGRRPVTAPVEMTKGSAALPATVVAEQKPFSSPWAGQRPMTPPVEMTKVERSARVMGVKGRSGKNHYF